MKYAKVEIRLTEQEKMALKVYAAKKGQTMSQLIRLAIDSILKGDKENDYLS